MAKKPSPEKPAPSRLLPGFQHLIPSAAAAPLAAHIRPLFLPDLVQQIARNKQIDANRREQAHPAFRKWAKDLKQGVLQQLHETQVEQDFNHVLLRGLGYTTQSDVASDQPWTLTPSDALTATRFILIFVIKRDKPGCCEKAARVASLLGLSAAVIQVACDRCPAISWGWNCCTDVLA
ncbi:MAG TPA: hypothetical protein VK395_35585 [Gemmataceae bacterium]|nr:hypothetical protein [Gemmataceae bacterium]